MAILSFYYFNNIKSQQNDIVKVGVILPLTGESAYWGQNIKEGIELGVEEINENGGILNKKIHVLYEDSKGRPKEAVSSLNKLISTEEIKYVIGDVISTNILAMAPIAEKNQVLLIGFGESDLITSAGDFIFRNWNSASSDADITGEFAIKNTSKIILLSRNDAFGESAKKSFLKKIDGDIKIVDDLIFETDSNEFKTIISKFKNKEYDGIYFAGFHGEAQNFIKQYIELGGKQVNIYGVSSWEEKSLIDFISNNYYGDVYYGYPKPVDNTSPVVMNFHEKFKLKYNKSPEILSDNGYDAIYMYKQAIESSGNFDILQNKKNLYLIKDFDGASGKFSVDKNGDVNKPFGLKRININGVNWVEI